MLWPCLESRELHPQGCCFTSSTVAWGECRSFGPKATTPPFIAWSKRRCALRRFAFAPTAGCQTIGTSSSGRSATAISRSSCSAWPICTRNAGNERNSASATDTCIKAASSRFRSKATNISMPSCATSSETRCGPDSSRARKTGDGEVCINECGLPAGRCWALGRCRNRPTGRSTSTCRRPKRNSRPFAAVFSVEVRTVRPAGSIRQRNSSGCTQRCALVADPAKKIIALPSACNFPNICACPLYLLIAEENCIRREHSCESDNLGIRDGKDHGRDVIIKAL